MRRDQLETRHVEAIPLYRFGTTTTVNSTTRGGGTRAKLEVPAVTCVCFEPLRVQLQEQLKNAWQLRPSGDFPLAALLTCSTGR